MAREEARRTRMEADPDRREVGLVRVRGARR